MGTSSFLKRLNGIKVTRDDIWKVLEMANSRHQDPNFKPSIEANVAILMETFPDRSGVLPEKLQAIYFRMKAISQMMSNPETCGVYFLRRPDGSVSVNESLIAAVAETPLIEVDGQGAFDPTKLFRNARRYELSQE